MNKRLRSRSGVATAIIVALIAAIIFAIWAWNKNSHATKCLNTLQGDIATYNRQWQNSIRNGSPDAGICRQLNTFMTSYNSSCGKRFGNLPMENCG